MPHVVGTLPQSVGVVRPPGIDVSLWSKYGAFKDGDVVAWVAITGGADPETQLNTDFSFGIAFGDDTPAAGRLVLTEIHRIGVEVDATLRKFEPFLP